MQTYLSNIKLNPKVNFDESLFKQLEKHFPGTAVDYKEQMLQNNSSNIFLYYQLNELLTTYSNLVSVPKRMNFLTKKLIEPNREEIEKLELKFWQLAPKYASFYQICSNCSMLKKSEECEKCFIDFQKFGQTYSDVSRTNLGSKYSYFRKQHFFECIIQFQGKQHATICPKLLDKLKQLYEKNHNVNMTKYNVMMWLKDMNATKHYGDVHLIFSILTKIPCPNLENLELDLLTDFDVFLTEYNKNCQDDNMVQRKNFINIQFVLFQLLNRHGQKYKQDDFILPRTVEIRKAYEILCRKIFNNLGWNLTSICLN